VRPHRRSPSYPSFISIRAPTVPAFSDLTTASTLAGVDDSGTLTTQIKLRTSGPSSRAPGRVPSEVSTSHSTNSPPLTDLGGDVVYREFGDRAHEGFQGHYPDVIRWLNVRPRRHDPLEVFRISHTAIIPVSRRVHWIETDARAGLVHARVTTRGRIDIRARWTKEVRVYLNDRLVELDKPVEIWVNGQKAFQGLVPRSIPFALDQARTLADERRIYAGSVRVRVPDSPESRREGEELWKEVSPTHEEGILSFWEMYAMRALEERFPSLGLQGEEATLPVEYPGAPEQVVVRISALEPGSPFRAGGVRAGDLLVEVGGEPFFQGLGGLDGLHDWLLRELRGQEREYSVLVLRDGDLLELSVRLGLGAYQGEVGN